MIPNIEQKDIPMVDSIKVTLRLKNASVNIDILMKELVADPILKARGLSPINACVDGRDFKFDVTILRNQLHRQQSLTELATYRIGVIANRMVQKNINKYLATL